MSCWKPWNRLSIVLALASALGASPVPSRAAGEPAVTRETAFRNGDVELFGDVLLPAGPGPFPGAVVVPGAGDNARTHVWTRMVAASLVDGGIAVLVPDKRGSGASGGNWRTADFEELAGDAVAAFERLRAQPEVAPDRVGYVGLSQGGHIAPLAAKMSEGSRFAISISGGATPMDETVAWEVERAWRREGVGEAAVERALVFLRRSDEYARSGSGWNEYLELRAELERDFGPRAVATFPADPEHWYWKWWGAIVDYDPLPHWRAMGRPGLLLYGERDEQAPVVASVERVRAELGSAGVEVEAKVFPDAGHGLLDPGGHQLLPGFVELLAGWIHEHSGP